MAKQNYALQNQWKRENTDRIQVTPRKSLNLPARIQKAIEAGRATSRQEYIITAILERLERDGF